MSARAISWSVVGESFQTPPWRPRMRSGQSRTSIDNRFSIESADTQESLYRFASGIDDTLRAIEALRDEPAEVDEEGYPSRPTDFALAYSGRALSEAASLISNPPAGTASCDINGGVRVTWRSGDRELRVVIPGTRDGRGYVYYFNGARSRISDNISFDSVAGHLVELTSGAAR